MQILIADDDSTSRRMLQSALSKWRYEVVVACDGEEAWRALEVHNSPRLLILDWMMPGLDGPEICRRLRAGPSADPAYVLLLTARRSAEDIACGLDSGADDYMAKPFTKLELRARVRVGERTLALQRTLAGRVKELEAALQENHVLRGILPICSYCKKIRDDQNYWRQLEVYLSAHSRAQFSHGICPECYDKHVLPELGEQELKLCGEGR